MQKLTDCVEATTETTFLFDLDGTLVLTDDIYYDVWRQILQDHHLELTPAIFAKHIHGQSDCTVIQTLRLPVSLDKISALKDTLFLANFRNKIRAIAGAVEFVNRIRTIPNCGKIGVVTNCNRAVAKAILVHIGLSVDVLVCADDCQHGKPSPEPYLRAISQCGVEHDTCIIFEDSKSGILSAKAVFPKLLVGIETQYTAPQLMELGVDTVVAHFDNPFEIAELLELVLQDRQAPFTPKYHHDANQLRKWVQKNSCMNIAKVELESSKLKGGFIADVVALQITPRNGLNNAPLLCVIKYESNAVSDLTRMAKQLDMYAREIYFYEAVAPFVPVNVPRFYGAVHDETGRKIGFLMENVGRRPHSPVLNPNLSAEPIEVAMSVVRAMANMHIHFWGKPLNTLFPQLKRANSPCFQPFMQKFIGGRANQFAEKWGRMCPTGVDLKNVLQKFAGIQDWLATDTGGHLTLVHGDIKSANLFYDRSRNVPIFMDWQHCMIGRGVQDLIFFVLESFGMDELPVVFPILKNHYYRILQESGIAEKYSFAEYEHDLGAVMHFTPLFTAVWFGTVPEDELIDKNWVFFFIQKVFYFLGAFHSKDRIS